ncbi:putative MFS family arabinose efflux permease [Acinetobacter baylyi]|uniref:MFS family arabinose efflux permease n=1 Tax=Acinetobacter baylyi TaxID=202950 RepID=A0ABU0UT54_ACIBI|nr:MFS transporter [Acinetobacter baylyi]MDQ1207727.1 putative MFS family arabinose efflux permease [Acinetobacter baylyi]MDR6105196.1 putative MFS family arabinose efflux permease [Acinetobacter baylyi]MDR6184597.1 putative MFS family arabinose efflux permease [Acinetobacter baylyi]
MMQNTFNFDSKKHLFAIFIFAAISPFVLMAAPVIAQQLAIEWSLSPSQIGNFFFVELGMMSLATLPAYLWSKKISFRKAAVYASSLFIFGNFLSLFAKSFDFLLMCRAISAVGGGSLMVITITSCSITSKPDRTYGLWVLGQVLLGALALFFLPKLFPLFGMKACYVAMLVVICIALPFHRYFADFIVTKKTTVTHVQNPNSLLGWFAVLATLLFYIAVGGVWTFMSSIAAHSKIDPVFTNSILAISTLVGIVGCFLPTVIGDKLNRKYFLVFGYSAFVVALWLLINQVTSDHLMIAILIFKFIWMFTIPFVLATVASHDATGKLMNTVNLVVGGGLAIGPMISGRIIESTENFNFLIFYSMGLFILSFIIVYYCNRGKSKKLSSV